MTGAPSPRRPSLPDLARLRRAAGDRRAQASVAIVVVVALTATLLAQPWAAPPPAGTSHAPGGPVRPSTEPEPDPDAGWAAVQPAPFALLADLEPSAVDAAGIRPDATFTLTSLTDATAADLAARLEVSPTTEITVLPSPDGAGAILRPTDPLTPGTLYRFALRGSDDSLAGSWAFRVRTPVHVLSTIPGDRTTAVPVRTGIELTFDQDGVADMRDHFSIEPAVDGRFEGHGRTQVFVPDGLEPQTTYTVRVRAGLARSGTDLILESDVVFQFETEGPGQPSAWLRFGRDVIETGPADAPVVAIEVVQLDPESATPPNLANVEVAAYRLPSVSAASSTLAAFLAAPRWTEHSQPTMATDGLPVASRFTAALEDVTGSPYRVLRFPVRLDPGWYIVELAGPRHSQAFLQVTSVSAWVSVLTDRTVVWANDVSTRGPAAGATVSVVGGAAIGVAGPDGLLVAPTPTVLIPPAEADPESVPSVPPLLSVRSAGGDTVLVPFEVGWDGGIYRGEWWEKSTAADSTFWSLLYTERSLYRQTDRVEAWGYLRDRDDGSVPSTVELRIVSGERQGVDNPPVIVGVAATPDASGAFAATLALDRLPLGSYSLEALVDGRVAAARWLEVGIVRKPAFELSLDSDRTAVVAGTSVRWTARATFFDGSPVPSLNLFASGTEAESAVGPTDAAGLASIDLPAQADDWWDGAGEWYLQVRPAGPEEAETYAWSRVVVFPSAQDIDATGQLAGDRLSLDGSVATVDLAAVEAQLAAGVWDGDGDGPPVAGTPVQVSVTELIPVRRQVGTDYDFIEKIARPRYEWDIRRNDVRTETLTSAADGTFTTAITVPDPDQQYEVLLTTLDPARRTARLKMTVGAAVETWWFDAGVRFRTTTGADAGSDPHAIGETFTWRMTDDGEPVPAGGANRYLYVVAQRGLVDVAVENAPTFTRRFAASDAPGVFVMGVRFSGVTYAPKAAAWASFDEAERRIAVDVSTDRARYRPGEDVTLTVRTTDADGRPIAARVQVQAVDEKLFAIDGASVPRPLEDLHARVDSGIVRLTSTHQLPTTGGPEGEGGDTTGGGPRADFRDTLAFVALDTGEDGTASTRIRLSDDLTSWHVVASAVTAGLRAGVGEKLVPVGLPLFVDATIADEYLAADRPMIRLRAYGEALRPGDPVEFTISSRSLDLAPTKVGGVALTETWFELPALAVGRHELDIGVVATTRRDEAGKPLADRVIRRLEVVASRLAATSTAYVRAGDPLPAMGGDEAATYLFTDAGRGRYVPLLTDLAAPSGARLDRALAHVISHDLLVDWFGRDAASLPPVAFDPTRYPIGWFDSSDPSARIGLALLPYGRPDPWLAMRVALIAPERVHERTLHDIAAELAGSDATARDLRVAAVAALAALGEPVLDDLRAALEGPDLTVHERIWLGLGFRAVGDDATARRIEQALLAEHGQRRGPWVRLRVGSSEDEAVDATALFALLAAGIGDPLAPDAIAYVTDHPSRETSHALELAGAIASALERTPAAPASFAWTVDGRRTVVRLAAGESLTITLTADQRSTLSVERLTGDVGIAIAARIPVDLSDIPIDPDLTLTRTIPRSPLPTDSLVVVDITATFTGGAVRSHCYEVEEVVPSGLAPVATVSAREIGSSIGSYIGPSSIVGQRVTFCAPFGVAGAGPAARMRYVARVVNAGTFRWEPAIMQLGGAGDVATATPSVTVRIGD